MQGTNELELLQLNLDLLNSAFPQVPLYGRDNAHCDSTFTQDIPRVDNSCTDGFLPNCSSSCLVWRKFKVSLPLLWLLFLNASIEYPLLLLLSNASTCVGYAISYNLSCQWLKANYILTDACRECAVLSCWKESKTSSSPLLTSRSYWLYPAEWLHGCRWYPCPEKAEFGNALIGCRLILHYWTSSIRPFMLCIVVYP